MSSPAPPTYFENASMSMCLYILVMNAGNSTIMTTNVLALMQELRDTREKLRIAENQVSALRDENQRLRQSSGIAAQSITPSEEPSGSDQLLTEMKLQLSTTLKRNAILEQEFHDSHTALRKQFEGHIDRLELELRRVKAAASQRNTSSSPMPRGTVSFAYASGTPGRTGESRKNLL